MKKLLLTLLLAGGAQSALAEEDWVDLTKTGGEALFGAKCGMCHRANGMGTVILGRRFEPELALLENREDLQVPYIRNVVRNGFNIMFPMSRGEVSDEQLEKIAAYLSGEED